MPSESPKWIALTLSVIAVTISCLSWWESHRVRVLNEAVNRPVLVIADGTNGARVAGIRVDDTESPLYAAFSTTLHNSGKVTATIRTS